MTQHLSIPAPVSFTSRVGDNRARQGTNRPTTRKCPSFAMISTTPDRLISMPVPGQTYAGGYAVCIVDHLDAIDRANLFSRHLLVIRRRQVAESHFDVPTALRRHTPPRRYKK